jgi:hypothetical protein
MQPPAHALQPRTTSTILEEIAAMLNPRNVLYVFVATCALAVAACQPAEGPVERSGKSLDNAAKRVGNAVDKAADKVKDTIDDAKK